jgi:hypothetical protein
VRRARA